MDKQKLFAIRCTETISDREASYCFKNGTGYAVIGQECKDGVWSRPSFRMYHRMYHRDYGNGRSYLLATMSLLNHCLRAVDLIEIDMEEKDFSPGSDILHMRLEGHDG